jgi:hypothetical protein
MQRFAPRPALVAFSPAKPAPLRCPPAAVGSSSIRRKILGPTSDLRLTRGGSAGAERKEPGQVSDTARDDLVRRLKSPRCLQERVRRSVRVLCLEGRSPTDWFSVNPKRVDRPNASTADCSVTPTCGAALAATRPGRHDQWRRMCESFFKADDQTPPRRPFSRAGCRYSCRRQFAGSMERDGSAARAGARSRAPHRKPV